MSSIRDKSPCEFNPGDAMRPSKNPRPNRPEFDPRKYVPQGTVAFAVCLTSAALLGGLLGLFEQRSRDDAMAQSAVPASAASGALLVGSAP
jgi:hypothetical protein